MLKCGYSLVIIAYLIPKWLDILIVYYPVNGHLPLRVKSTVKTGVRLRKISLCSTSNISSIYIKMNVCLYVPHRIVNYAFDHVTIFIKIGAHEPVKISKLI